LYLKGFCQKRWEWQLLVRDDDSILNINLIVEIHHAPIFIGPISNAIEVPTRVNDVTVAQRLVGLFIPRPVGYANVRHTHDGFTDGI
jgi:hypothetical protein